MDYKALYEAQQQETDIEHQRFLEIRERFSNKLWEVCQELDIENDDTSQNIIQAIKELKEENKKLREAHSVPEQIKKEWNIIWDCLAKEEENVYNQEGNDPELETDELEDGWTYKSMRVISDWMESSKLEDDQLEDTLSSLNFYQECNQELKQEVKKLKKTISNYKKIRKIQEEAYDRLEKETEELNKDIRRLQKERNYLGDYEGGATSEEEEDEFSHNEFMKNWLSENLTEDMVGSESIYIVGYGEHEFLQDDFENDMVAYCFNNYSEMSDELKQKWEEELAFDDGEASHHENVGVLAEHIEDYFLNVLKVPKSKMQEWSEFWEKKRQEEEDEDQYKNYGVMLVSHETNDEDDIGYYDTLEEAQSAFKETIKKFADCRVVIFDTEDYNPFEDNIGTIHIIEDYNNQ
jgi:hypothetical protein